MKNVNDWKMEVLNEKNTISKEEWHLFILWLIEEFNFPVEEHFNLYISDCSYCEERCSEYSCKDRI